MKKKRISAAELKRRAVEHIEESVRRSNELRMKRRKRRIELETEKYAEILEAALADYRDHDDTHRDILKDFKRKSLERIL